MKRDMEYIRELLLKIEGAEGPIENSLDLLGPTPSDEDTSKLNYHLEMLIDETGFVTGIEAHSMEHMQWMELKLTWRGHEFIEQVRDPEVWARTKEGAKKAGNFGIEFLIEIAKAYGKHVAKERLGIDLG